MLNLDKLIPRTKLEIKQQQKLDRLRESENLRRERIFSAKNRIMGADREGLFKQMEEKKLRKLLEEEQEVAFHKKLMADIELANTINQRNENIKKELAKEVDVYRLNEQQKYQTREYDLNDPKRVLNQLPMRFTDITDPRELTMGSFLKFQSEDYDGEKSRILKKHLWQCLAKQMTENLVSKNNYKIAHLQSGKDAMKEDELVNKLIKQEEQLKAEAAKDNMLYNNKKAEYERSKKQLEKQKNYEDDKAHINTLINSDFLKENRDIEKSSLGLNKMVLYNYKGMTFEEKHQIQEIQLKQIEEIKQRKNDEEALQKYWKEMEKLQSNVKTVAEKVENEKRKQRNKNILEENKRIAAEQALQREIVKKNATDNFPTDEFFNFFNTSTR